MRPAETADLVNVHALYQDAVTHANTVGKIDWPDPVPPSFVSELINTGEMYCFGYERVEGVAKLSRSPDSRIWASEPEDALYLAKLATSSRVRNQDYFERSMLPEIMKWAGSETVLRLDCLADNVRLQAFYRRLGFVSCGDVTFFSKKQDRTLTVTRLEKQS